MWWRRLTMSAPYIQANINGTLQSAAQPGITPLDRGFLYGDAVYEVWRTYGRVLFAWEAHWERLERSAAALFMDLPLSSEEARLQIRRTASAFREETGHEGELYVRLQISRGSGAIGLDPALAGSAHYVILVQRLSLPSPEAFAAGVHLSLARNLRRNSPETLNPAWKTGNYLNNVLCLREARQRGADEVLITNLAGEITEAAVTNVAFVRGGEVLTPPLAAGILAGITRHRLFSHVAPAAGISIREEVLRPEDLPSMDECFLLSTTRDVQPVRSIDDTVYRTGADTIALRLKRTFAEHAAAEALAHPELGT